MASPTCLLLPRRAVLLRQESLEEEVRDVVGGRACGTEMGAIECPGGVRGGVGAMAVSAVSAVQCSAVHVVGADTSRRDEAASTTQRRRPTAQDRLCLRHNEPTKSKSTGGFALDTPRPLLMAAPDSRRKTLVSSAQPTTSPAQPVRDTPAPVSFLPSEATQGPHPHSLTVEPSEAIRYWCLRVWPPALSAQRDGDGRRASRGPVGGARNLVEPVVARFRRAGCRCGHSNVGVRTAMAMAVMLTAVVDAWRLGLERGGGGRQ
ncbi:hypothetical protein SVAN01_05776 [Stagonosporopsis vannaccii]|nr:hypothetical protein SVAN01_05776 [Stagonosporopsis vannaccii]